MSALQAMVHMAINTGIFPVSGQTLPLISMGRTSIIVMSMALGIKLNVSRNAVQSNKPKDLKTEEEGTPKDLQALNPTQLMK